MRSVQPKSKKKPAPENVYFNRELSQLEFNRRVLTQACDPKIPLLERLKFLCIFNANLDEFFEIRVAGLKQLASFSNHKKAQFPADQILQAVYERTRPLVAEQYRILREEIWPALAKANIHIVPKRKWDEHIRPWIKNYFIHQVLPLVSPIAIDPAHPMPRLVNKSLNFIVSLSGEDAFGRKPNLAIVHAPRSLQRVIHLPEKITQQPYSFILLNSVIEEFAEELFPGMTVHGCYQFRLTRDSDLSLDDIAHEDLAGLVKNKLLTRSFGTAVRLEVAANCPQELTDYLLKTLHLSKDELYITNGPVNLSRFINLYEIIDRPDLKYPAFTAPQALKAKLAQNIFATIKHHDLLVHHPFQSFETVLEFLQQATEDPQVLAIKQTLYRTGVDSPIVQSLVEAARAGKEVTAVIELRARFDEESNLALANRLQAAGVLVVYGVMDFKTHCKMILVVREENGSLHRYCHLGTGNYHLATSRVYVDYGLFTCDEAIGIDMQNVFQELTGVSKALKLKKLWQAPFNLAKHLMDHIATEIKFAQQKKPARIIAKLNGLTDPKIIDELYKASQAGVKIDLIVRGMCCLLPGIPGLSENIHVVSIVGRFLEHERIYYFYNNGNEKMYCSSADWMERNLYKRVEVAFPIEDTKLIERVKRDSLLLYLSDNTHSWKLHSDGTWQKLSPGKNKPRDAQGELLGKIVEP